MALNQKLRQVAALQGEAALGPDFRSIPLSHHLELKLQSKLHLSGRARISGGETRVTNDTEGRTANLRSAPRLTEVRMIEEVKNLPTEFD